MTPEQFNNLAKSSKVKEIYASELGGLYIEFENGIKVSAGINYSKEEFYLETEQEAEAERKRMDEERIKQESAPVLIVMPDGQQKWIDRETFNSIIKL